MPEHEFVVKTPIPVKAINDHLLSQGIIGGYDLGRDYDYLQDHMLICCTEVNTKEEIDLLVATLREANS